MTVLFFVGNGFDLNVGLKTRFKDVLPFYIEEPTNNDVVKEFKKIIDRNIDTWANFEEHIGLYTDEIQKKETTIETVLDFINCMFDFKKFLKSYLQNEEIKAKYDNTQEIAKIFKKSLLSFTECLNSDPKILLDEIDKDVIRFSYINFNYTTVFDNCLEILKKSNIFQLEKRNKTGFFSGVIYGHNDLGKVLHIHGTLDNNMILGVNDQKQIKNTWFRNQEKLNAYIKPNANEALENHRNTEAIKLLEDANIYCIFGMSLGKTDKKWWVEICKQLINFPEKQLVIYAYDETLDASFPENTLEAIDYYKIIFLNHLRFSEFDKDDLKERIKKNIHVAINKDIFKMELI